MYNEDQLLTTLDADSDSLDGAGNTINEDQESSVAAVAEESSDYHPWAIKSVSGFAGDDRQHSTARMKGIYFYFFDFENNLHFH